MLFSKMNFGKSNHLESATDRFNLYFIKLTNGFLYD